MNIVFFGSSNYILPVIEKLNKEFGLSLVVTTEKKPTDSVPSFCIKNKIEYISVSSNTELNLKLYNLKPTTYNLGIVADFGLIIPKNILTLFPKGVLNIHPSLLPRYRGATPVQTAILNGDNKTGVSIIRLDEKVDHGPILAQEEEPILPDDTSWSLYKRLFEKGTNMLDSMMYIIESKEKIKEAMQDDSKATYTKALKRSDGFVDLSKENKETVKRKIRAYFPWPGVWFKLNLRGQEKIVKLLPNQQIQVEGKKPMSYKDFANGYPEASTLLKNL